MEVTLSADCAPPALQVCVLGTSLLTSWDVALQPVKGTVMPGYYHVFLALFTVLRMLPELLWMSWDSSQVVYPMCAGVFMLVMQAGRQLKAPKDLLRSNIPHSLVPLCCDFAQGRQ